MHIKERQEGDLGKLRKLAAKERDAEQKDRLLVVAHAIAGRETRDIQEARARSRGFVQRRAYAYRDYDHLLEVGAEAWQALTPNRLRSICRCGYLSHREEV